MFDWDDLRYFLAVARHGSTLAAAKALKVNQSTVHRRLDELERRLGRRLVVRQPTGYKLTELGQDLLTYAERVEETVHSFERRLAASDTRLAGSVKLTCPVAIGVRLLHSPFIKKSASAIPIFVSNSSLTTNCSTLRKEKQTSPFVPPLRSTTHYSDAKSRRHLGPSMPAPLTLSAQAR